MTRGRFFVFIAILIISNGLHAQITYDRPCYGISAGPDSSFCSSACKNITRQAIPQHETRSTTSYLVQQMTMPSPAYNTTGTNVLVSQDDTFTGIKNIGFNFCFFGNTYNQLVIGANGIISFNLAYAGGFCAWSYTGSIPTPLKPLNSIMAPWTDVDPRFGGTIDFYTEGVAPCRRFVINYYQIPMYNCHAIQLTSQIILHEAYNIIDIVVTNKPVCAVWNGGLGIIGIQNATGTVAFAAPGNNPSSSPITNECWRFLPNGALQQTVKWTQGATVVSNSDTLNTSVCPGANTFTATLTSNLCNGSQVVVSDAVTFNVTGVSGANAGADQAITCTTPVVTLGSPSAAGNTYSWTPAAGLSNANIAQPTTSTPNTYILTVTNASTGCIVKDTTVITKNITPPVANAGPDMALTCGGVVIGTTAVAGYTYSWTPVAGLSNPAIAQPTATIANTYTVTVTNTANGCTASDAVNVTGSSATPVANAGADQTITCTTPGGVVIGSPSVAGNTYAWAPAAGLSNPAIAQPTATAPNTYILTVTKTASGCTAKDTVVVSQNTTPPVANAGPDKALACATPTVTIGTAAIAGNTYSWSPAAGLSNPNIAQPTANAPNTYTLTVTNTTNGCTATDAVDVTGSVTIPVANAGPDKVLNCTTASVMLGSPAVAGNTYFWTPGAALSNQNIAQPTTSAPNTYILRVTNTSSGCIVRDTVVVSQNLTSPVANAGPDKVLSCTSPSVTIGTAAVAGNTYFWSPAAGLSNASIAQPTASAANTYTLTVTNTASGCTASDAVNVTQNNTAPTANAGPDQTITCTVPNVTLGSPAVAGNTYSWSPAAGLSNPNIAQPVANAQNTYTLTVTNTASGCTATDAVTVSQSASLPTANAGADRVLTCTVSSVTLGTVAVAGYTYSWNPAAGLSDPAIAQPTTSTPNTYTLTVTNISSGCTATDAVTVSRNITSPTADAGADQTLTCGVPAVQIGTPFVAGNTYSWSPSAGLNNPSIAQPTANAASSYTLTVTNTSNGCTATDAVTITQTNNRPPVNAGPDQTLTCITTNVTLGTPAVGGNTYAWTPSAAVSDPVAAQTTTSTQGTYILTVTNTANGCTSKDTVIVTKNVAFPAANAGADRTLTCTISSITLGSPAVLGNNYSWSPSAGLSDAAIAQPLATAPNTYTLTVTNPSNGCQSTDAVTISQNITPPTADAGLDKSLTCVVKSVTIGTPAISGNTYSWSPTTGLNNPNTAQPVANVPNTYTLTVTNTSNGCNATDAAIVSNDTIVPTADAGPDQQFGCPKVALTLGTTAVPNISYHWTKVVGLSSTDEAQPTTDSTGTYVLYVINTVNGCISLTDTAVITPKNCECEFFVPSAFTPNNDGVNDSLFPFKYCDDYRDLVFSIFDRWGELVFRTNDINIKWDGFYKSETQEVDSYVWTLDYFDVLHNRKEFRKGIVTLLK